MHSVSIDFFFYFFFSEAWELSDSIIFDFPMECISLPLPAARQQLGAVLSPNNVFLNPPCPNGLCFLHSIFPVNVPDVIGALSAAPSLICHSQQDPGIWGSWS